jgi:hypothetical protein
MALKIFPKPYSPQEQIFEPGTQEEFITSLSPYQSNIPLIQEIGNTKIEDGRYDRKILEGQPKLTYFFRLATQKDSITLVTAEGKYSLAVRKVEKTFDKTGKILLFNRKLAGEMHTAFTTGKKIYFNPLYLKYHHLFSIDGLHSYLQAKDWKPRSLSDLTEEDLK